MPILKHAARGALILVMCSWGAARAGKLQLQVVNPQGNPLAQAVVYLESPEAAAAARPAKGVEISQSNRQFVPAVTVVPVGTAVELPNRDTVRHHVYSFSPAKTFELKLYSGRPASPVVFDKPGVVSLGCNIHDQMSASVVVVETPYFALTGTDGRAVLDAPAGVYRLRGWHASMPANVPPVSLPTTVGAGVSVSTVQLRTAQP